MSSNWIVRGGSLILAGAVACSSSSGGGTGGSGGAGSTSGGAGNSGSDARGGAPNNGGSQGGGTSLGGGSSTGGAPSDSGSVRASDGGPAGGGGMIDSGRSTADSAMDGLMDGGRTTGGDSATGQDGGGGADPFVLSWQDDFNTLNPSSWQLQTFTFGGSLAQFSTQNATVANGILTLALTPAPNGSPQPYLGVEMRSTRTLTYGKISARMRFATGSGVVSGLVLFYTPFPNCDWNEIDIEHLGNSSTTSQLNAMVYLGTSVRNCTTSVAPTQDPLITSLGFNAETDFHQYDVEWTPAGVRYLAGGVLLRTWTKNIALLTLPQTVLLTIWASSAADWAGPLTPSSAPTSADVDWIKVYDWNG